MKKIILCVVIMILCCSFISCAELVSEEILEVNAVITEVDRDPMRMTGKIVQPPDYDIYFEYEGAKGSWDVNKETYGLYKDKVGETIKCYLITRTYDNGSTKVTLKAAEDK